jgi:hypothetical protein
MPILDEIKRAPVLVALERGIAGDRAMTALPFWQDGRRTLKKGVFQNRIFPLWRRIVGGRHQYLDHARATTSRR